MIILMIITITKTILMKIILMHVKIINKSRWYEVKPFNLKSLL